jgi:hypothetical protein
MIDRWSGIRGYNYGCVTDLDHYLILVMSDELGNSTLYDERVHIYSEKVKYQLSKKYDKLNIKTAINIFDIDAEKRVQFSFKKNVVLFEKDVFDFSNFKPEKAVQRIKTLLTFK